MSSHFNTKDVKTGFLRMLFLYFTSTPMRKQIARKTCSSRRLRPLCIERTWPPLPLAPPPASEISDSSSTHRASVTLRISKRPASVTISGSPTAPLPAPLAALPSVPPGPLKSEDSFGSEFEDNSSVIPSAPDKAIPPAEFEALRQWAMNLVFEQTSPSHKVFI
jgi:hypothetical protein